MGWCRGTPPLHPFRKEVSGSLEGFRAAAGPPIGTVNRASTSTARTDWFSGQLGWYAAVLTSTPSFARASLDFNSNFDEVFNINVAKMRVAVRAAQADA